MTVDQILEAMRADDVPVASRGLWYVRRAYFPAELVGDIFDWTYLKTYGTVCPERDKPPPGRYTYLLRWTEGTVGQGFGELVMNDFPSELRKHLDFVMKARGRVLVTGLGLGCVVRGLLARGRVDHIDLVERDNRVIELAAASVSDRRVKIHVADAREWLPPGRYDYAWHDLWSDPDRGEPHLQRTHFDLMAKLMDRVPYQGAWAMPRRYTKRVPELRLGAR